MATKPGWELLELLVSSGVGKRREPGRGEGNRGWVSGGWSTDELAVRSAKLGWAVAAKTWARAVAEPELDGLPYVPRVGTLRKMVLTLQHLGSPIKTNEALQAWERAKTRRPDDPPIELNVIKFGASATEVIGALLEATTGPARVDMLVELTSMCDLTVTQLGRLVAAQTALLEHALEDAHGDPSTPTQDS